MFSIPILQAWRNVRENTSVAVHGIIITSVSLTILGTLFLFYLNLTHLTHLIFDQSNYSVFVEQSADRNDRERIRRHIEGIKDVTDLTFIPAEKAKEELIESFGESGEVLHRIQLPKFPDIIEFSLNRRNALVEDEMEKLKSLKGVDEVVYGLETKEQIDTFFTISEFVGIFLISMLIASIILIIHNSIQIAVRMRIKEIEVLKILGATSAFVRVPFIIEGLIIAILGYILSLGFIYFLFTFVVAGITFSEQTYYLRDIVFYFSLKQMLVMLSGISILGILSSTLATNKVLQELDV